MKASVPRLEETLTQPGQVTGTTALAHPALDWPTQHLQGWRGYAFSVAATAVALGASMLLAPYLSHVAFILFWPMVLASAIWSGLGPALLASLLSVVAAQYWLISGGRTLRVGDPSELVPLAVFVLTSTAASTLADRRRAAARSLTRQARELEQQRAELEAQLEESQALSEELEETTSELEERTREAQEAGEFSRGILESISDPFVVQDADWRFRYINEAAAHIFSGAGRGNAPSLVGRVLWEVYPDLVGSTWDRQMHRAARERVPVEFEAFYAERGTWAQMRCYPLADGGLATQWTDITARKKAEEALHYLDRASELLAAPLDPDERLRDLAHLVVPQLADWCTIDIAGPHGQPIQVAVAHVDPSKEEWARELNRQYPPAPDAPTGAPNVLRTGHPELIPEITDEMLVAGAVDQEHLRMIRELGLRSAMVVPLSARGETFGALSLVSAESRRRYTVEDLSLASELARRAALAIDNSRQHQEAVAARQAAEAANYAKAQFLAAMSHELRTPLNAIAGYVDLALLEVHGPLTPEQRTDLERVRAAQRHLLQLISEILDFARIEAHRVEFDIQSVPLASVLAGLDDFVDPQLRERRLQLQCDDIPPDLLVRVDVEKARQIILNLLSNAVKFTGPGGRIHIGVERHPDRVLVRVADNGVGIAPERLTSIFEPFVQAHRSLTEPTRGVGLGLSISRELARGMGGDLTVQSTPAAGSTFTFVIPPGESAVSE